jgi:hypothetical protein
MDQDTLMLLKVVKSKNDLNARRRRFYSLARRFRGGSMQDVASYYAGYCKAQAESKALTPMLRKLKKQARARTQWDVAGFIKYVRIEGKLVSRFKLDKLIEDMEIERILLVG